MSKENVLLRGDDIQILEKMRLIALLVGFSYSVCAANLRGVDPSSIYHLLKRSSLQLIELKLYQGPEFECLDKRKRIPISQVNDDYCDCLDGSDEPGMC